MKISLRAAIEITAAVCVFIFFSVYFPPKSYAKNSINTQIKTEIVLKRFKPLSKQMTREEVTYVIKRKHNLKGKELFIPKGCTLLFKGGCITNGIVHGEATVIEAGDDKSFSNVILGGSWNPDKTYPEWFGAIGDGVIDDTYALQKAVYFAEGNTLVLQNGKKYKYTQGIKVKSNTSISGEGAIVIKACYSAFLRNEHSSEDVIDENIRISGLNGITLDNSYRGLWLWMVGVKGLTITDCSFENHTPLDEEQHSQWCVTVSGEDIDINNCRINTYGGGLFSDGIHVYNAINCAIHDCVIITEDDCIGFAPEIAREQVEYDKYNQISTNVNIYNNRLTGTRNCIRFEVRENAPKVFAYQNVHVWNNVLDGKTIPVGSFLYLHDYRKKTEYKDHSFIVEGNKIEGTLKSDKLNFIELFGKNPVELPIGVMNIKNVSISGIKTSMSGFENYLRCIGAENVVVKNCSFSADDNATSGLAIRESKNVSVYDCYFSTYSQYPFIQITNCSGEVQKNRIERLNNDNNAGIGIFIKDSDDMTVERNEISNFSIGLSDVKSSKQVDSNSYRRCNLNVQRRR